jgi:hypothetical protein
MVRRTWLAVPATVAVCALFAAHAVAALLDARYLDSAHGPSPLRHVQIAAPAERSTPDGNQLVARNMFCSTCSPEPGPMNHPATSFVPEAQLIATSISRDPAATIVVPGSGVQGSFGVGDALPGVGTITSIGFITVELVDAVGRTGTLSLLPTSPSGRGAADAETSAAPAAAEALDGRIRRIDDTTYDVERSLVRDLVGGNVKAGGVRIVPVTTDGKLDGLRLIGVRPGSPAAALGLKSRDVLQAINGDRIESANTLLGFYAQLDALSTVELAGTRDGKPLTLVLRLH